MKKLYHLKDQGVVSIYKYLSDLSEWPTAGEPILGYFTRKRTGIQNNVIFAQIMKLFTDQYWPKAELMETGNLLKRIRLNLGLTKGEAAEKSQITDKTYRKYENEGTTLEKFINLAETMGADIEATRTIRINVPDSDPIVVEESIKSVGDQK